MFTGIIQWQGKILDIHDGTFKVQAPTERKVHIGQSIAHDGACMSVTAMGSDRYSFFAMQESFAKTNFGDKQPGDAFNLETCIQADSMLDGHIVTGHIDTTAKLIQTENAEDGSRKLVFSYDPQRDAYVIPKGSIAINGVSLTVVDALPGGGCSVRLIPLTLEKTNLGHLAQDESVNVEFDMLGKYVVKYMQQVTDTQ